MSHLIFWNRWACPCPKEWVQWISDDPTFRPDLTTLAIMQGQAVGFIANADDETSRQRGYIIQMGVHPAWRGQRIAAALVTRSLRSWQEEGKDTVLLHVNINNPGVIHLYQQLGFVIIRRRGRFQRIVKPNQ